MIPRLASLWMLAADATTGPGTSVPSTVRKPGGDVFLHFVVPLLIVFFIMYVFILSPQRKREKRRKQMLEAVKKGNDVVTIGGIHGKVWQIKDQEVILTVGDGTKMTFSRGAIARVVTDDEGSGS